MDTAERFERAVEPTSKALEAALSLIDRSKETSVPLKGSVWELATSRVVGLEKFESSVRDLKRELDEWHEESESLERSLGELESAVEESEGEGEADYDRVVEEFTEAMRSMEALEEKTRRLETNLREASEKSANIAERAGGVPVLGGEIKKRFEVLSARLSETADEIVETNRKPSDVVDVRPEPRRKE
jgi:chromosome segregation ATPase